MNFKKIIGPRSFYRRALAVAVPMMIQNGITNFVNMLDNLMVGQIGTEQLSAVSIANQLIFVFNLTVFGGLSGAGIFTAQYFGKKDMEGVKSTVRIKAVTVALLCLGFLSLFTFQGDFLISLFLHEGGTADLAAALLAGKQYLFCICIGLIPFSVSQVFGSTLRETGDTVIPMKASLAAVFVNLVFNYILIFGHFGAPRLGVLGAAIATALSRFVEVSVILIHIFRHRERFPFFQHLLRGFSIPIPLLRSVLLKGTPLLLNELLWSSGIALQVQCYSIRGLEAVAAVSICDSVSKVFKVVFLAFGNAISILAGQHLGAGKTEQAKITVRRMIAFSCLCSLGLGLLMVGSSGMIPALYNTSAQTKAQAQALLIVTGLSLPLMAVNNAAYFTLRCGGKTLLTFLFDGVSFLVFFLPFTYFLTYHTTLGMTAILALLQILELAKCSIGLYLIHRGVWIHNIVGDAAPAQA